MDCKSGTVDDGTVQVTGSITFTADGFTDDTTTTITEHLTLDASCLMISGTHTSCPGLAPIANVLGFTSIDCVGKSGGGCTCTANLSAGTQQGGLGFVDVNALSAGSYTTSSSTNTFTVTDGRQKFDYQYCVSGSALTLLPKSKLQTVSGSVTLSKS